MRPQRDRVGRRDAPNAGFTLVELLVVLAIVAVATAAVPRVVAGLPGVRLRAAADEMAAVLRELHGEAIRRQTATELTLDPAARVYVLSTAAAPRPLPEIVAEAAFVPAAAVPAARPAGIRFYPDGSASGGTVRLVRGNLTAAIGVDWLTGRVTRHD